VLFFRGDMTSQKLSRPTKAITVDGEKHGSCRQLGELPDYRKSCVQFACQIQKANPL